MLLQFHQVRKFDRARTAPRPPEIDERHFAVQVCFSDLLRIAGQRLQAKASQFFTHGRVALSACLGRRCHDPEPHRNDNDQRSEKQKPRPQRPTRTLGRQELPLRLARSLKSRLGHGEITALPASSCWRRRSTAACSCRPECCAACSSREYPTALCGTRRPSPWAL